MQLGQLERARLNAAQDQIAIEREALLEEQALSQEEIDLIEGLKALERDIESTINELSQRAEATFQDFSAEDYIPAAQLEEMLNTLNEATENMALGLWIQRLEWGEGQIH